VVAFVATPFFLGMRLSKFFLSKSHPYLGRKMSTSPTSQWKQKISLSKGSVAERFDKMLLQELQEHKEQLLQMGVCIVKNSSISRSSVQKMIRNGLVCINGKVNSKLNHKLKHDDEVSIDLKTLKKILETNSFSLLDLVSPPSSELTEQLISDPSMNFPLEAENLSLNIVHEDNWLLVVNKPAGMMVHPSPGHFKNTLVNGLLYHCKSLSTLGGLHRPGIVHRLDRDTSGLMVIAKDNRVHEQLKEQFANRQVLKKYAAVVVGKPKHDTNDESPSIIDKAISRHPKDTNKMRVSALGKEAITEYRVLNTWSLHKETFSFLDVQIRTGRTHQIRVHFSSLGNPIVGDPIYCRKHSKHGVSFLLLASYILSFYHPETKEKLYFETDLPPHITEFLSRMS